MNKLVAVLALCCALNSALAASAPSRQLWVSLPPAEQQALAPLQAQWNSFPEKQQHNLRYVAQHSPKLSPIEKQRFQSRLVIWAKLTPAQRDAAREKYRAFSQLSEEKREQVKLMIKQQQALKARQAQQAASAVIIIGASAPAAIQP